MTKMALTLGIVAIVLAGALLFTGFHAKRSFAHDPDRFIERKLDKIAETLELNTDQKAQLTQMAQEMKTKHEELRGSRTAAKEEIFGELSKDVIDKAVLDAHYSNAKRRFDEVYELFTTRFVEFHQSLTPEQREKLVAEAEKRHEGRCGFHRRWHDDS